MKISAYDFKDLLDRLSRQYDISKEWIIRNGVYLLYMICDGVKEHRVDGESLLLSEDAVFKGFCKYIDMEN